MKRAIVTPPALPSAALAELKDWLGITTAQDDGLLSALLRASFDLCEDFTGSMPIASLCEELLPATGQWQHLATRPVQAITQVLDGTGLALPASAYAMELDADGGGRVRLLAPGITAGSATRITVRFTAGIAADWASLPEALRHGIIRLAAHQHRMRDTEGAAPLPPAAVAALWRPWRRMRLA